MIEAAGSGTIAATAPKHSESAISVENVGAGFLSLYQPWSTSCFSRFQTVAFLPEKAAVLR